MPPDLAALLGFLGGIAVTILGCLAFGSTTAIPPDVVDEPDEEWYL